MNELEDEEIEELDRPKRDPDFITLETIDDFAMSVWVKESIFIIHSSYNGDEIIDEYQGKDAEEYIEYIIDDIDAGEKDKEVILNYIVEKEVLGCNS